MSMALDLSRALDPTLIASDCGITLDKWQGNLMRSSAPRVLLLCSRQSGKTTTTGFIGLGTAIYKPGSLTLILSPSQRQSAEMQRTIMGFHAKLQGASTLTQESILKSEFSNGSRIIALPGTEKTIRGYAAADLIIIDEASRVEDELLAAVRPMLATSKGRLIALTTPAGKRGWFFESWTTGGDDWHRVRVPASDCPRITQEFLAEELRELGAMRFSEEYGLEFRDNLEAAFPQTIIEAAFSQEVTPLWA
jgi:hypothetical protein